MGLFSKKADPISNQARALEQRLAALQSEIKQLDAELKKPAPLVPRVPEPIEQPAVRSTVRPREASIKNAVPREPIFESVEREAPATGGPEGRFNELGVRKYDIAAEWRRFLGFFRGPSAHNPKLVSYLAAGSIRGLQPLRYEKRIARNRFIALTIVFLIILCALFSLFRL